MKKLDMVYLYDLYAPLLNDRQREILDLYYNEDQSLAEISENVGITRQGVRDCIIKAEALLSGYEEALGLRKKLLEIEEKLDGITREAQSSGTDTKIIDKLTEIKDSLF